MTLPPDFVFTQGNLQDYVDCPRRFELKYLQRQRWPAAEVDDMVAFERHMEQGAQFHRLVQQSLLGIPPETLQSRIADEEVALWFDTWLANGLAGVPPQRWPELTLTATLGERLLLAKLDLVAIEPGGPALLLDWKTGRHLPRPERLAQRMQTLVYRYVLAQAGARLNGGEPLAPERIEMRYWYAQHGGAVQRFPYSAAQMRADRKQLLALLREIEGRAEFPLTETSAAAASASTARSVAAAKKPARWRSGRARRRWPCLQLRSTSTPWTRSRFELGAELKK